MSKPAATPGVELAQTISMITGVAISPLLGVSAVGVWKYAKTPPSRRASLPWFAQPWFWVPGLVLVIAVFVKDSLGPAVPTALKKPFDIAELFENKLSALVAAGAFIPLVISIFPEMAGDPAISGGPIVAAIDLARIGNALMVPFAIVAFAVVWLASHTINILILISPFGAVDAALKAFRLFLLATVAATSFANPYLGAAWAMLIMVICWFIAGWSFRMTVFGTVFAWDLLTLRRNRHVPGLSPTWAFTARELDGVPVRTYGRVLRDEQGDLAFTYKPWLVLKTRTLTLPRQDYAVGRGLLSPDIIMLDDDRAISVLRFPPRCRTHEEALASQLGCNQVHDIGLKAMWGWLREFLGLGARGERHAVTQTPAPA